MIERYRVSALSGAAILCAVLVAGCGSRLDQPLRPQCGQHCLHRVSQLLGVPLTLRQVVELCPPKQEGESLLELKTALETIGFEVNGVETTKISEAKLSELACPFIASLKGHFVVVDLYR